MNYFTAYIKDYKGEMTVLDKCFAITFVVDKFFIWYYEEDGSVHEIQLDKVTIMS